jgi:hypothetical protein
MRMAPNPRMILATVLVLAALAAAQASAAPPQTPQPAPAPAKPQQPADPDAPRTPPPPNEATPDNIGRALKIGIEAILDAQEKDGHWESPVDMVMVGSTSMTFLWGNTAMALLTLETLGIDLKDERYQRGLKAFFEAKIQTTYEVSLRTMLLARLARRSKEKSADTYREFLKLDAERLLKTQLSDGGWTYNYPQLHIARLADFSNTQMAVLALSEAVAAGIEIPPPVFEKVQALFLKSQADDGGWNYASLPPHVKAPPGFANPYGSMTAVAVATLIITRDLLTPQIGCPCNGEHSPHVALPVDRAIERGTKWLAENFVADKNPKCTDSWATNFPYWLYAVQRVGLASGYKYLGPHDWYHLGATVILNSRLIRATDPPTLPWTCFSMMFLAKGQAPFLANKLQFDGEWNLHPRDLANVVHYVSGIKETPVQFQVINLESPVAEWHDAPILYISAENRIPISKEQKQKLKTFTDTGGTILFEASCGNGAADKWLRELVKELWPGCEFQAVTKEHPLWTADQRLLSAQPKLLGLNDGLRTFLFYAPSDISCAWGRNQISRDKNTFALAGNLYAYATDKAPLRSRAVARPQLPAWYAAAKIKSGPRATLKIARLRTGGDFTAGASYQPLENYNRTRDPAAPQLDLQGYASASASNLADLDVLWLAGRQDASLNPADTEALKTWLAAGGFLLAEAVMGDPRFAKSFTDLAKTLGLTLKPQPPAADLIVGNLAPNVSGYNVSKVRFTPHLAAERISLSQPDLQLIYLDDKLVGVWSPDDVCFSLTGYKAFGNLGYEPDDARAIATNIFLLAGARPQ